VYSKINAKFPAKIKLTYHNNDGKKMNKYKIINRYLIILYNIIYADLADHLRSELFLHKQLFNIKIEFNTYFTVTNFTYQLNDDVHSN